MKTIMEGNENMGLLKGIEKKKIDNPLERIAVVVGACKMITNHKGVVYFDTEVTSLGKQQEICQIAMINEKGEVLIDTMLSTIYPSDPGALAVHGITTEMTKGCPSWQEAGPDICKILDEATLIVGYNVSFDIRAVVNTAKLSFVNYDPPVATADVMTICALWKAEWNDWHKSYKWQKLDAIRKELDLVGTNSHNALEDTLLTKEVVEYFACLPV